MILLKMINTVEVSVDADDDGYFVINSSLIRLALMKWLDNLLAWNVDKVSAFGALAPSYVKEIVARGGFKLIRLYHSGGQSLTDVPDEVKAVYVDSVESAMQKSRDDQIPIVLFNASDLSMVGNAYRLIVSLGLFDDIPLNSTVVVPPEFDIISSSLEILRPDLTVELGAPKLGDFVWREL